MRIKLPSFETKKELFSYLVENKADLITQKKSMPIVADVCKSACLPIKHEGIETKDNTPVEGNPDQITVRVVANTSNIVDSHLDMLLPDSAKKSIKERKSVIPHIHDHIHTTTAKLGKVNDITLENLSFKQLGLKGVGTAQAIVFETQLIKSYNEKVFNLYKDGEINQHSIGLQYVKLDLAVNDPDFKEEFALWEKHVNSVINKDAIEDSGFFFPVSEIKLIENSAVLFGSNPITPTLDNNLQKSEPTAITQDTKPDALKLDKLNLMRNFVK